MLKSCLRILFKSPSSYEFQYQPTTVDLVFTEKSVKDYRLMNINLLNFYHCV